MEADSPVLDEHADAPPQEDQPVDRLDTGGATIVRLWLPEASQERLDRAIDANFADDPNVADGAKLIVVSTRGPRARSIPLIRRLRTASDAPVVVLCHAGGERTALEIMRAGGAGIVAEGNESSLGRFLGAADTDGDEPLVRAYEGWAAGQRSGDTTTSAVDGVTGLPGPASFGQRVDELAQTGAIATIGYAQIANFAEATTGLDRQAVDVLRRRLASLFRTAAERAGAELFVVSAERFAFIGRELPQGTAEGIGQSLYDIARSFAPGGTMPMIAGVGFAGPDVASDMSLKRELAERSLEEAMQRPEGGVVGADQLSSSLASATELDVALRMVHYLSEHDGYPGSHSTRVADTATELARHLGYEGRELVRVRLGALLHDVGKVGLPPEAMRIEDAETAGEETLALHRSHPERGARFVRPFAGAGLTEAIRAHHERWDGTGFPDGLAGDEIPVVARIIALADVFDGLRSAPDEHGRHRSVEECLAILRSLSGSALDPAIVDAAPFAIGK